RRTPLTPQRLFRLSLRNPHTLSPAHRLFPRDDDLELRTRALGPLRLLRRRRRAPGSARRADTFDVRHALLDDGRRRREGLLRPPFRNAFRATVLRNDTARPRLRHPRPPPTP